MKLLLALLVGLTAQMSMANEIVVKKVNDDLIKEIVIEKVSVEELSADEADMIFTNDEDPVEDLIGSIGEAILTGKVNPASVVNVAQKAWVVLKQNEPVLNAKTKTANALPEGLENWRLLERWQAPRAETYKVQYKNLYGSNVVTLNYRLVYSYGGQAAGVGKYLTNVAIQYQQVEVTWGYILNAHVTVPQVLNMGTMADPVAGMEIMLNWNITTRPLSLKKGKYSTSFFVSGDGSPTQIL